MAICLPGMASKVKRAATSDTRSAPLVMTISWTSTMMKKITKPTTTLPPVTSWPKFLMTTPGSPVVRIIRVLDTFIPSRNRVVMSSREGKMENSSASEIFIVIIRIMTDSPMLMMSRMSKICGGSGINRNMTTTTTNSAITLSKIRLSMAGRLPPRRRTVGTGFPSFVSAVPSLPPKAEDRFCGIPL